MILQEYLTKTYDDTTIRDIITNLGSYYDEIKSKFILNNYQIKNVFRPDELANEIYSTPEYEWVLLLVNGCIDPWNGWCKNDNIISHQVEKIYANVPGKEFGIHHFIDPVTDDIYYDLVEYPLLSKQWYHKGDSSHSHVQFQGDLVPITNFEYEIEENENKRTIKIIRPQDVDSFNSAIQEVIYVRNN